MKLAKQFKNKNLKIAAGFCLLVFVFNFSLVRAEETFSPDIGQAAPSGQTSATFEAPAEPTPALAPEPATTIEPATIVEIITPEELLTANPADNLRPQITTTTVPIVFDLSQPVATSAPEINNNAAGASESVSNGNLISHEILTGIIRDANIKQLTILAQWQMLSDKIGDIYVGKDDSAELQAQFLPSGQFEKSKSIAVCALVADVGGLNNINNISAAINYPEITAKAINQAGEKAGCGQLKNQFNLEKLNQDESISLVCDKLKNNNNNLLAWGSDKIDNLVYSYEHVCGQDGLLAKQAAEFYCAQTFLDYDDPAGDYAVKINAKNNNGAEVTGENYFKYLELTTFENDFSQILYGPVKLNELKILKGDLNWGESTQPTVRNTGNTREQIKIWQNDFGLGKTGDEWNLSYQAKIGTSTDFISYLPEQTTVLNDIIELGQSAGMDFSVLIKKFPEADSDSAFWGKMILSADKVAPLSCR